MSSIDYNYPGTAATVAVTLAGTSVQISLEDLETIRQNRFTLVNGNLFAVFPGTTSTKRLEDLIARVNPLFKTATQVTAGNDYTRPNIQVTNL